MQFFLSICVLQILQVVAKINLPLLVHAQKLNGAPVHQQGALTNVREHGLGRNAFFQAAVLRREKPVNSVKAAGTFVRYLLLIQCRYFEYYL